MERRIRHLSDGLLLLLLEEEGALSARRGARARAHLAACPRCAARQADLATALREAGAACRGRTEASAPHAARVRLRAALEAGAARSPGSWRPARAAVAAGVLAAVLSWPAGDGSRPGRPGASAPAERPAEVSGRLLPRPDLTPGSVRPVGVGAVCGGAPPAAPAVASQVPRQVFEAYGVDYRRAADYELDFLITPELGGASDAGNLWPQPYRRVAWNAYVKDELERHLQRLVCRGAVDLATAQRELAGDWIAAYKRRFDTERPLRDYGRFPLTARDVDALRAEANERRLLTGPRRS